MKKYSFKYDKDGNLYSYSEYNKSGKLLSYYNLENNILKRIDNINKLKHFVKYSEFDKPIMTYLYNNGENWIKIISQNNENPIKVTEYIFNKKNLYRFKFSEKNVDLWKKLILSKKS